jgi:hypothetical protein
MYNQPFLNYLHPVTESGFSAEKEEFGLWTYMVLFDASLENLQ